jgi:hypothetical protein
MAGKKAVAFLVCLLQIKRRIPLLRILTEGGHREEVKKGECGRNITYLCMKTEK